MTEREQFIAWLNDARSTELAQIPVLQNHAEDARDYPEIYQRDMQHLEETRRQARDLEEMIESLGGSVSTVKTAIGKILGWGHSISTEVFPDELIKNFLSDYAAEHFEIASYQSLIATARAVGEERCIPVLERILREEIAMARWLEDNIALATRESLKVVASNESYYEYSDEQSERSSRKRNRSSKRGVGPALTAILVGGSVGAAATLLSRSKNKRSRGEIRTQNSLTDYKNSETAVTSGTNASETVVIAMDESGSQTAAAPKTASGGNS